MKRSVPNEYDRMRSQVRPTRSTGPDWCSTAVHEIWPSILCLTRGYCTSRDSADRMCQSSVWICKEQAFWLVSRVVLLYILIERKDPAVSIL
jgi:hypothetical protein